MKCTVCQRITDDQGQCASCKESGERRNLALRSQIQPLRAQLVGCKSPEMRQALRRQINQLSQMVTS